MPITKSAIKALRQDKRRALSNRPIRSKLKSTVDAAKVKPEGQTVSLAFSAIDKAVKKHIIHRNKAARIKSALAKLLK